MLTFFVARLYKVILYTKQHDIRCHYEIYTPDLTWDRFDLLPDFITQLDPSGSVSFPVFYNPLLFCSNKEIFDPVICFSDRHSKSNGTFSSCRTSKFWLTQKSLGRK